MPFFTDLLTEAISNAFHYDAKSFEYVSGVTPMSTVPEVVAMLGFYFAFISLLVWVMKGRAAFQLKYLFALHNLILTVGSLALLVALWESILPDFFKNGLHWAACSTTLLQKPLIFFYYINYLVKYVELLDTVFLVLKKKPLTFLHVFHHSMTALLCFTQISGNTTVVRRN